MNATLIHHFLENSAQRFPDKVALVHEEVRATYRQINGLANQLARYFISYGVEPGNRIVILLENSLEYVVAYYAALKAGAVAVPMNTELKVNNLLPLLHELEAECMVSSAKFERLLRAVDLNSTAIRHFLIKNQKLTISAEIEIDDWDTSVAEHISENLDLDIQQSDLGSIIYTSGSTGRPKGTMLSHGNIVANVTSICHYLCLTENDIQMVVLPFFYVMGKSLLNSHMAVGGRVIINNKFAYPATVIQQMIDEKVTGFSGVPSTYAYLLHKSPLSASRELLGSLRYFSQAGGHMASSVKQQLMEVLPGHTELFIMYGATEASARLAYVEPNMLKSKIDSIGRAIPGVTLRVLDEAGQELPVGEVGELVATGDNITQGYWKNPEATAMALTEFGYHTGDLGYRDQDEYFFIVGRKDNQLKVSGHKVNTQEIEDIILDSNLVVEVAVVGIADQLVENRLVAVAVAAEDHTDSKSIIEYCSKRLPVFKVPQEVLFVKNLPKSASGKVDRKKCEELIQATK